MTTDTKALIEAKERLEAMLHSLDTRAVMQEEWAGQLRAAASLEAEHAARQEERRCREDAAALRTFLAALASYPQEDGWRPIESAPKDGTRIDLWVVGGEHGDYRAANAQWDGEAQDWRTGAFTLGQYVYIPVATHWRPLPAPPLQGGRDDR